MKESRYRLLKERPNMDVIRGVVREGAWTLIGFACATITAIISTYLTGGKEEHVTFVIVSFTVSVIAYIVSVTILAIFAFKFLRIFAENERMSGAKDLEIERLNSQHTSDLDKISEYDYVFRRLAIARAEFDTRIFKLSIEASHPILNHVHDVLVEYLEHVCNTAVIAMSIRHGESGTANIREITEFVCNIKSVVWANSRFEYSVLARSTNTLPMRAADDRVRFPVNSHACFVDCLKRASHNLNIPDMTKYIATYKARGDETLKAPVDLMAEYCKSMFVSEMYVEVKDQPDLANPSSIENILKDTRDNWVYGFLTVESKNYVFDDYAQYSNLDMSIFRELGTEAVSAIRFYNFAYSYASSKLGTLGS